MNTYPEMNAKITKLLRCSNDPKCLYAAERIEELEAREAELREALDIACERLSEAFCVLNYPKNCPPDDDCPSDRDYACKPCWKRWAMEQALEGSEGE